MSLCHVRFVTLLLALLCGLAGSVAAQAPPAPSPPAPAPPAPAPSPPSLTVMVVDVQALLQNSKAAKMVRNQIEQKGTEYSKEIHHREEVLRNEREVLQRQQPSASQSAESLQQKVRDWEQRYNDLARDQQTKSQIIQNARTEALSKIQEGMLKIIDDIAKQRKANLIFQSASFVFFDKSFDVSDEVLQKLDEQMPALTVNFVAPAQPSTGAAPASAAASGPAPAPSPKSKKK